MKTGIFLMVLGIIQAPSGMDVREWWGPITTIGAFIFAFGHLKGIITSILTQITGLDKRFDTQTSAIDKRFDKIDSDIREIRGNIARKPE